MFDAMPITSGKYLGYNGLNLFGGAMAMDINLEGLDGNSGTQKNRMPRDLRYREQHFPGADQLVFKTSEKGFVPVPIALRKTLRFLSSPEVRLLLYLYLRCSRYGICYPPTDEIVHELGLTSKKNLLPHLSSLEEKHFISIRTSASKTFYLVHDPRVAVKHMLASGLIRDEDLIEINDLYADLNQTLIDQDSDADQSNEADQ
jgi:hypothetical protein